MLPIYDITGFSILDYPDKLSSLIWFSGCNYKCCYCHNPDLIHEHKNLSNQEVFDFLKKRNHLIQSVVLTGGECTLYNIYDFVKEIKSYGYLIKIDTNGSKPNRLKQLINDKLIDYIALDFKSTEECFYEITKTRDYQNFLKTLILLIDNNDKVDFEIRTTIFPEKLEYDEIKKIIKLLIEYKYNKTYYIQNYRPLDGTLYSNIQLKDNLLKLIEDNKELDFKIELRNF